MAIVATQTVCIECNEVIVTETTGLYNATDNPGGYGTPNPDFGETTPYTIGFIPPKGTTVVYELDLNEDPPAPDADDNYVYPAITAADLGLAATAAITSGVWTLVVTFGTEVKNKKLFAWGDINARINHCVCCGGWEKYGKLRLKLKGAMDEAKCFQFAQAQSIIDQLYRDTENCCGDC